MSFNSSFIPPTLPLFPIHCQLNIGSKFCNRSYFTTIHTHKSHYDSLDASVQSSCWTSYPQRIFISVTPKKLGPDRRVRTLISDKMCVRDKLRLGWNLEGQCSLLNLIWSWSVSLLLFWIRTYPSAATFPPLYGLIEWVNGPFEPFYCYDAVEWWLVLKTIFTLNPWPWFGMRK